MPNDFIWKVKVAARLHDPAEKALVLLRDPAGHENGTSLALARLLGFFKTDTATITPDNEKALATVAFRKGIPQEIYRIIQRADHWAAAADRPQWPMEQIPTGGAVFKIADWAQVRWANQPELIHPLSGEVISLRGGLSETELADIKDRSLSHFKKLLEALGAGEDDGCDWRKVALALWRFGPEIVEAAGHGKLGELWKLLPADTRVPDHTIWDHLDLVSAFAGAFAEGGGEPALLVLSIGPVQSFIAAARKVDDLWAGSHLLSRLSWEASKPVCEQFGPDAIRFPRLRGIPQVDLWLRDEAGLPAELFKECGWRDKSPDENPLFAATLPNRFVAVVPQERVEETAERCRENVRRWLLELGLRVVDRLLEAAGIREKDAPREESIIAYQQMRKQLEGFPEVHWAAAPFSLVAENQKALDVTALAAAMEPFYGKRESGFLASSAWKALSREVDLPDGTAFYTPKPGVVYPAIFELAERLLAAAKSVRAFEQERQEGWRCTLTGETEWLTHDRSHLTVPRGERKHSSDPDFIAGRHKETLWTKIAKDKPVWTKEGEHLGALAAIKRLWPTLFAEEVKAETKGRTGRFTVSTHTMALAGQLEAWLQSSATSKQQLNVLRGLLKEEEGWAALPRRLAKHHAGEERLDDARRMIALLDMARDSEDEKSRADAERLVRNLLTIEKGQDGPVPLERYYALLMMDGDHMGEILSGGGRAAISFLESFHTQVRQGFSERSIGSPALAAYAMEKRPPSPARHMMISAALNDFSQVVVPHVVEEEFAGRLIYAGGDDVLAMLPVRDVLAAMQRLRDVYSGLARDDQNVDLLNFNKRDQLVVNAGFAVLNGRLMRMMGPRATASCGVVVAHHMAPLSFVLRELRKAERRAKDHLRAVLGENGRPKPVNRDAFNITVVKRSGGTLYLSAAWGEPLRLLIDLRNFLASAEVSRRAVYNTLEWLAHLPQSGGQLDQEMLETLLAYQFSRQSEGEAKKKAPDLAERLAKLAAEQHDCSRLLKNFDPHVQSPDGRRWLENFLSVAEFLARVERMGGER